MPRKLLTKAARKADCEAKIAKIDAEIANARYQESLWLAKPGAAKINQERAWHSEWLRLELERSKLRANYYATEAKIAAGK